jgi:hypothetical protein
MILGSHFRWFARFFVFALTCVASLVYLPAIFYAGCR